MHPSPSWHSSFSPRWFQDSLSFISPSPHYPHFTAQCRGQTLPWAVPGARCETLCSNRETISGWSHKSHCLLDAANQWEHQDLYPALRKSRARIRQTNHAAGICGTKSTSAQGSEMVWINHTPLPGANSPAVLFSSVIPIIAASQPAGAESRAWPAHGEGSVCLRAIWSDLHRAGSPCACSPACAWGSLMQTE